MKSISFAIAIGLSAVLMAGCGTYLQREQSQRYVSLSVVKTQKDESAAKEKEPSEEASNLMSWYRNFSKKAAEWKFTKTGFDMKVPDCVKKLKGQVRVLDGGEIDVDTGIFCAVLDYVPKTDEETEKAEAVIGNFNDDNDSDGSQREAVLKAYNDKCYAEVLLIYAYPENMSFDEVLKKTNSTEEIGETGEIGRKGGYKYSYLVKDNSKRAWGLKEVMTEEYYSELETLTNDADSFVANITLTEPQEMEDVIKTGSTVSFETKDLDGNLVSSKELFANHKVTMINFWRTTCGPCKEEMPELEKLNREIAKQGCQIIGICDRTADDESNVEEAKEILKKAGVTYTNHVLTDEIDAMLPVVDSFPTTYFVDSEGKILTQPVSGADFDRYMEKMVESLEAVK